MRLQAQAAERKRRHPEQYCPAPRCLWRTGDGTRCPRHPDPEEGRTMAKIDLDEVLRAVEEDDDTGFCLGCGSEAYGVEPDAERYPCEVCGEPRVYGAFSILLRAVA